MGMKIARVLGLLAFCLGVAVALTGGFWSMDTQPVFQSDNAIGATANRIGHLLASARSAIGCQAAIVGLLIMLLVEMSRMTELLGKIAKQGDAGESAPPTSPPTSPPVAPPATPGSPQKPATTRWRIEGVDRESGLETSFVVEASSRKEAGLAAMERGVQVTGMDRCG